MSNQAKYDEFIGFCFVEWQKIIKGYDGVVIKNFDPSRVTNLLVLKIAALNSFIHKESVFIRAGLLNYWRIKLLTKTSLPRLKNQDVSNFLEIDCDDLPFFNRPAQAAGISLRVIEDIYRAYYEEE